MPNYCDNTLTVSHRDKEKIIRLHQAIENNSLCQATIPIPEDLKNTTAPSREPNEMLIAKYGVDNWYNFCLSQWGTKWDIFESEANLHDDSEDFTVTACFLTAWSPPLGIYRKLIEDGFEVDAMYFEAGMCFAGTINNEEGEHYYEDLVNIPDEIKDEFGISESLDLDEEEE